MDARSADSGGRLAVEIGGTFTDIIYVGEGSAIQSLKVPSTPQQPDEGVISGVNRLDLALSAVQEVLHGSTVGTNAVLERKGAGIALLVTEGFKDLLEIQRGDKRNIYDILYQRTPPLVPRHQVYPIAERVTAAGEIQRSLDESAVLSAAKSIGDAGLEAVAICFLHSYVNTSHEQRAKALLESALPGVLVVASSELLPQFREYERASTTVMSAYVSPIMNSYVSGLDGHFRENGFAGSLLITQSNGGVLPAQAIKQEVVRTLLSGPAAGVTGAVHVAAELGLRDLITLDMGGTSTDVCLINGGEPLVSNENTLADLPVSVPMIDINTVGAGGGSIAHVDAHGMLHVGPESAGAEPGPACYGKGGASPTVTDANVVRGVIRASSFAGGAFPLDRAASERVLESLGRELEIPVDEAAEAVTRIVEANMMQAIRVVSTQRGFDPRSYTLVAFGGAGPIHAAGIAQEMGIESVLVPARAGLLSAYGLLVADVARDYVQTRIAVAEEVTNSVLRAESLRLVSRAESEFAEYGFDRDELVLAPACDVRYQGQAYELTVPCGLDDSGESLAAAFHDAHRKRYGFASPGGTVEVVNYRLKATVSRAAPDFGERNVPGSHERVERGELVVGGRRIACDFYTLGTLPEGSEVHGPAVVEDASSTCLVPDGWRGVVQRDGSLLMSWSGHEA